MHAETIADVFIGTRQANWFVQGSGSFDRQNHFRLSDDFSGGTLQPPGDRDFSYHQDYKINLKAVYEQQLDGTVTTLDEAIMAARGILSRTSG